MNSDKEQLGFSGHPRNVQHALKVARLLNQTETGLARVLATEPTNFLERQYGRLLAAVDLTFTDDFYDVSEVLLDTLQGEYYSDLNRSTLDSFEAALTAVNQTLADLAAEGQNQWVGKLNAVLAVIHENEIHVTQIGKAHGYLVRGPSVTQITEGLSAPEEQATAKTFINVASGQLEIGDKLLLATPEIFNHISQHDIRRYVYLNTPERAIRKLADQLTAAGHPDKVAAVVAELTTIDLISAETVSDDPEEIILGAPRGHFETMQRFKPLRPDSALAAAAEKAKKWFDQKAKPGFNRQASGLRQKVGHAVSRRQGEVPDTPPRHAAGTPETAPGPAPSTRRTDGLSKTLRSVSAAASPMVHKTTELLKRGLAPLGRLLRKIWHKSGVPQTAAWQSVARGGQKVAGVYRSSPLARLLSGGRGARYRNLLILLLIIFVVSLYSTVRSSQDKKHQAEVRQSIASVTEKQGKAELAVIAKDTAGARQQISEAKREADALKKEKNKVLQAEIVTLQQKVAAAYDQINNVVAVPDQPAADFTSLTGGTTLKHAAQAGTTLYVMGETGAIHSFSQTDKLTKTTNQQPGLAGSVSSVATTSSGDVLILTDKPTLYVLSSGNNALSEAALAAGAAWEKGTALDTVQQNAFVLDPDKNQLWRHTRTLASFSKGEAYFSGNVDLKRAVDVVTGAQVYVSKDDGSVLLFTAGAHQQNFSLQPPPAPQDKVSDSNALAVNFNSGNIYVSDPGNKRVLEFNGKGEYARQFRNDAFAKTEDVIVDDKTNTLYILSDNKLYQIGLG